MGRNVQYSRLSLVCPKQLLCGLFLLFFKLTGTEMGPRFRKVNREQVENVYSIKMILKYFKVSVIPVAYQTLCRPNKMTNIFPLPDLLAAIAAF